MKAYAKQLVARLKEIYPDATCALAYGGDPWKLLVMGRLSAQCTDARVNQVSVALFEAFPNAEAMAKASPEEVEPYIFSCGLYRAKAKDLVAASRRIVEVYGGKLPETMEELLTLAGVGRKIANLLLGDLFGKPAIVADTHCIRICGRLGFYPESLKDPHRVEAILSQILAPEEQSDFCHRIVWFGREICTARSPKCADCPLRALCKKGRGE